MEIYGGVFFAFAVCFAGVWLIFVCFLVSLFQVVCSVCC